MTKITEIIPDNLPDWAIEAMSDGQLFAVTFDRIQAADKEIARVSLDTMAEGMLDVIVTPKDAAVPDDPVARRDERAVRIIDGYQAKDAELARLRGAINESIGDAVSIVNMSKDENVRIKAAVLADHLIALTNPPDL